MKEIVINPEIRLQRDKPWFKKPRGPSGKATYVHEIVEEYKKSHRYKSISRTSRLSYDTALEQFDKLILYTGKSIMHMKSNKVEFTVVDYLIGVLSHSKKPATIRVYMAVMSNVFENAKRMGYVWHNPFARPNIPVKNERDLTWSKADISKAIAKAKEMKFDVLAMYILLCYETALRPYSDGRELMWSNIKTQDDGTTCIDLFSRKTNLRLMIPISKELKEALAGLKRVSDYILIGENGLRYTAGAIAYQLRRVVKEAGIDEALQFRDIRRTAITELAESGATETELRAIGGWTNSNMIKRYARIRYISGKSAMNKRWAARDEHKEICGEPSITPGPAQEA